MNRIASLGSLKPSGVVTFNEINFMDAEEKIELKVWDQLGGTIDLNGYTLVGCSGSTQSNNQRLTFQTGCAKCVTRVVDPGDIITVVLNSGATPNDTSCSGAATTCTWNSKNTSTPANRLLVGGELSNTSDAILLSTQVLPLNDGTADDYRPYLIDQVTWGTIPTAPSFQYDCSFVGAYSSFGLWQTNTTLSIGLITDATKSVCLTADANNEDGALSWQQCNSTIGATNSTGTSAIKLTNFIVSQISTGHALYWQTTSEFNTVGFILLRSDSESGPFLTVQENLIEAAGGSGYGATYEYFDTGATDPNVSYYYKLQEVTLDGLTSEYGPFSTGDSFASVKSGDNDDSTAISGFSTGGCGRILAPQDRPGACLALILVLLALLSTRTHYLVGRN